MKHSGRIVLVALALTATFALCHVQRAQAQPSADQVISDMGLSADVKQRVLNGEFVTTEVKGVAGFLPVQEGTFVVYTNHTFTDQVAGFGGAMKRGVGRNMMASKPEEVFKAARQQVQ
jgi:hypothetical protein